MERPDRRTRFLTALSDYERGEVARARGVLVELWSSEVSPARASLVQALLLVVSATERASSGAASSAARLADEARSRLVAVPDGVLGVDVAALAREVDAYAARLSEASSSEVPATAEAAGAVPPPRVRVAEDATAWDEGSRDEVSSEGAFAAGLAAYERGEYFEAHERWEEVWRAARGDDERQLTQGLVQVTAAMWKCQREGKPGPAARLLERAMLRLTPLPRDLQGLDLGRLLREGSRAHAVLAAAATVSDPSPLEPDLVPRIARVVG